MSLKLKPNKPHLTLVEGGASLSQGYRTQATDAPSLELDARLAEVTRPSSHPLNHSMARLSTHRANRESLNTMDIANLSHELLLGMSSDREKLIKSLIR